MKAWFKKVWNEFLDWYTHEHDPSTEMKDEGISEEKPTGWFYTEGTWIEYLIMCIIAALFAYFFFF